MLPAVTAATPHRTRPAVDEATRDATVVIECSRAFGHERAPLQQPVNTAKGVAVEQECNPRAASKAKLEELTSWACLGALRPDDLAEASAVAGTKQTGRHTSDNRNAWESPAHKVVPALKPSWQPPCFEPA